MDVTNNASYHGITTPPAPVILNLGGKVYGRLSYYVELEDPGLAGTLTVVVRWKDRDGQTRSKTSAALSLLLGSDITGVVHFYTEDDPDTEVEVELVANSVSGSYQLSWWWLVEGWNEI